MTQPASADTTATVRCPGIERLHGFSHRAMAPVAAAQAAQSATGGMRSSSCTGVASLRPKTNSVYLPRRKHWVQALEHPRQINLVGLKRLDGGTYGDCKRPAAWVKPRIGFGRAGAGFTRALRVVAGASSESRKPSGCGKPGSEPWLRRLADAPTPGGLDPQASPSVTPEAPRLCSAVLMAVRAQKCSAASPDAGVESPPSERSSPRGNACSAPTRRRRYAAGSPPPSP